ncbi:MAG: NAD(P)H-dependent oxidoreductase subunit E [Candidatus Omnitrophota bacterium]|jgi:NADH-quinone oxidoreductase E subunit
MANLIMGEIKQQADVILARYETKRAAMLEVLRLMAQRYEVITPEIEEAVAGYLEVPVVDVHEVVTFYTLYPRHPKGKTHLCVCRTLSCALRGSGDITQYLEERLGVKSGETTADGEFSLEEVECLGACESAPMMQINDGEYVGNLTKEKIDALLKGGKGKV